MGRVAAGWDGTREAGVYVVCVCLCVGMCPSICGYVCARARPRACVRVCMCVCAWLHVLPCHVGSVIATERPDLSLDSLWRSREAHTGDLRSTLGLESICEPFCGFYEAARYGREAR